MTRASTRPGRVAVAGLLVALALGATASCKRRGSGEAELTFRPQELPLSVDDLEAIARAAAVEVGAPARIAVLAGVPTYVALRRGGALKGEVWTVEDGTLGPMSRAVRDLRARAGKSDAAADSPEAVELAFLHDPVDVPPPMRDKPLSRDQRGVLGLEITHGDSTYRVSPTAMISRNLTGAGVVKAFLRQRRASAGDIEVRLFAAEQVLVTFDPTPLARRMWRGNEIVALADVTRPRVEHLADLASSWLIANLQDDGRMVYGLEPSLGKEMTGNNMIRQWMATLAMERVAARREDEVVWAAVERNIDHNLGRFYAEKDGVGLIRYEGESKLGAIALAALAIVEHPRRSRWKRQEEALRRAIDGAWHDDGSFSTYLEPAGKSGQNNFYPGETLLLWATLLDRGEAPELAERFTASFRYYKRWHLKPSNRNPAFVPWHTQAYYLRWKKTRDAELAAFVFEMNDWLLGVQDWKQDPIFPDLQGRFYDPTRRFGAPHSSADGVYIEGLADAHALALELGDQRRAASYRTSLLRVLRNVIQLQFDDDIDLFYVAVADRDTVRGGIRTAHYDSQIRVDNVQHSLMGIFKLLDRWPAASFAPATAAPP